MSDTAGTEEGATADARPQLIEPKKEDVVLCTYPDTLDGWVAAWVVRGIAQKHKIPVEFQLDVGTVHSDDTTGRNWISIGPRPPGSSAEKSFLGILTSVDQGKPRPLPFKQWKRTFPFGVEKMTALADGYMASPSLAAAAWDFFYADRIGFDKRPRLIDYVDDSETEKFAFNDTKAVVACLRTYPMQFQTLDKLVEACDDRKRLAFVVTSGQAVLRYIERTEVERD